MSTDTPSLDKIDMKIIHLLQHNARMSIAELADKVGLSATPIKERMRRLQDQGVITGYHAKINPHLIGQGLLVFVEIKLKDKSASLFAEFKRDVLRISQIMECHLVSGEYDYLLRVAVKDTKDYERLLRERLYKIKGVRHSKSSFVLRTLKRADLPLFVS